MDTREPGAREAALRKIAAPALSIAVVAGIDAALCALGLLGNLLGISATPLVDGGGDERALWLVQGVWGAAWCLTGLGLAGFVLWAALRMRRLESYPLAFTACAISLVPCLSPCCILGVPFGIWGLIVMHDGGVRPHFPS